MSISHLQANKNNKPQTNANHVKHLRLTAQRCYVSLVEMEKAHLDTFTIELQDEWGLSKKTINNYKGSWKPFFRQLERPWASEIEFYNLDTQKVESWRVYSDEEIEKMLQRARGRTTAAIALMADTGCRIGAACSTFREDLDTSGDVAVISLNDEAPLKGAEGNVPLTWSRAYLVNYLRGDHPRPNQDGKALLHQKEGFDEDDSGAISPTTLRQDIKEVMKKIGISKRRRETKNFRHTAITSWLRMGIKKEVIKYRTKWADMSMLENYGHLHEEDKIEMTAEAFGLVQPEETGGTSRPEDAIGNCPQCGQTVRASSRYCVGCGNPITADAAHGHPPNDITAPSETGADLIEFDEVREEMPVATILEQILNQRPELLDEIDVDRSN